MFSWQSTSLWFNCVSFRRELELIDSGGENLLAECFCTAVSVTGSLPAETFLHSYRATAPDIIHLSI